MIYLGHVFKETLSLLAPKSWLGFYYQIWFPTYWVGLKFNKTTAVHCQGISDRIASLEISFHDGYGCSSQASYIVRSLTAFLLWPSIVLSCKMKTRPQEGDFMVKFILNVLYLKYIVPMSSVIRAILQPLRENDGQHSQPILTGGSLELPWPTNPTNVSVAF